MAANNDVKENEITQASAQATLANLKEVRVVLNDGSSKAYGKEDFLGVIAAGIKTYFQSIAASGITGFLTTDSGKGGISTPADAASVLGVTQFHYMQNGGDLNDYQSPGHCYYTLTSAQTGNLSNRPADLLYACAVYVLQGSEQILFEKTRNTINFYFRGYDNGYGKWKKVTGTEVEYAT